jgi:hypothetical protein
MTQHGRLLIRTLLLSMVAAVLIAGHGFILYYVSSHIKHLGLLGPLYAVLRRHSRRGAR